MNYICFKSTIMQKTNNIFAQEISYIKCRARTCIRWKYRSPCVKLDLVGKLIITQFYLDEVRRNISRHIGCVFNFGVDDIFEPIR